MTILRPAETTEVALKMDTFLACLANTSEDNQTNLFTKCPSLYLLTAVPVLYHWDTILVF